MVVEDSGPPLNNNTTLNLYHPVYNYNAEFQYKYKIEFWM